MVQAGQRTGTARYDWRHGIYSRDGRHLQTCGGHRPTPLREAHPTL